MRIDNVPQHLIDLHNKDQGFQMQDIYMDNFEQYENYTIYHQDGYYEAYFDEQDNSFSITTRAEALSMVEIEGTSTEFFQELMKALESRNGDDPVEYNYYVEACVDKLMGYQAFRSEELPQTLEEAWQEMITSKCLDKMGV